jgi:hypothetical protein
MIARRARALLLVSVCAAACGHATDTQPPHETPDPATSPRYDEVWLLSTHNAYWVDRGVKGDTFASGTQSRLLDQLLVGRARSIEIDVHHSPDVPQKFDVYHTTPGDVLCDDLARCLAMVRAFEWAVPQHEPLQITLELKELFSSLWDATHTIEDLDRILRVELGDHLFAPSDFFARCDRFGTHDDLSTCMKNVSWPGVDALRGKVIVSVMGNWDDLAEAQSTADWVRYATQDDLRARAAFPMASSWKLTMDALNDRLHDLLAQPDLDHAFAESAFLQIEDANDPNASPFIGKNGLVRVDNSFALADQEARIAQRMQLLQTDSPWVAPDDGKPQHALHAFDGTAIDEPGARLLVHPSTNAGDRVFAYVTITPGASGTTTTWETAVSSGASGDRWGCLRAASSADANADAIEICRSKISATMTANVNAERAMIHVAKCAKGACEEQDYPSIDPSPDGPGDLVAFDVSIDASGATCVGLRSADAADRSRQPTWSNVRDASCLPSTLSFVGVSRPTKGDATDAAPVLFAGLRRDGAMVKASDFSHVVVQPASGATIEDATKLEDASVPAPSR